MNEKEINEMIKFIKSCNVCVINAPITEGDGKIALENYKGAVNDLIILYEQEKEKNKELEKLVFNFSQERDIILKTPVISKDKIKEKIEELEKECKQYEEMTPSARRYDGIQKVDIQINTLEDLLEV